MGELAPTRDLLVESSRTRAAIDIGSNSVRLVCFTGAPCAPTPRFNERVLCGLGRGLAKTGHLNPEGVEQAFDALRRFVGLTRRMGVEETHAVATAAVRDAADGNAFIDRLGAELGLEVRVLSGVEEARLSALGVLSGMPDADGLMGDLGGGSLELVSLDQGTIGESTTLPFGLLRMDGIGKRKVLVRQLEDGFSRLLWLSQVAGRRLYLVGGTWRSIAKMHIAQSQHPLPLIHGYEVPAGQLADFCRVLERQSRTSLAAANSLISKRRIDTVPLAALILRRLIKVAEPDRVVFSAHGLREGLLFDQWAGAHDACDPLIVACREIAEREGRFSEQGEELNRWLADLFPGTTGEEARLRHAACLLSDIGWRAHPDSRADHAFRTILRAPFGGVDHPGRTFLALAVLTRYEGDIRDRRVRAFRAMLDGDRQILARTLGAAMRLGHTLSGATPGVLDETTLGQYGSKLVLRLDGRAKPLAGQVVSRRLSDLGKQFGLETELVV